MLNKKGQMSVETLIGIVIGVFILAFVIYGFATNWSMFSSLTPSNDVSTVVTQCQLACTTSDLYSFCILNRTLTADGLPNDASGKPQKQVINTCHYFATDGDFSKYSIAACPSVNCP